MKSIKEKIKQIFEIHTEENKNKLKNNLKEIVEKILNEINEDSKLEDNISMLSLTVEEALNLVFEIPLASEKSKKDITEFLDNLCKWFIGALNDIISRLVKENSDELGRLLLNEQSRLKNERKVEKTLNNERSFDQYRIESEDYLKQFIINKVYFLAIKKIYNVIADYIIEMSSEVIKEQFDKIVPEIKNNISDKTIKELSNKILQDMTKNQ